MRSQSMFLLAGLVLGACLQIPPPIEGGIEGQVTVGPMCPVMQLNTPCPDRPYAAVLTVLTTAGKKVTQFKADKNGHFRLELAAGEYLLHPESPDGISFAADLPFSVKEGEYTRLQISYDSGIR